MDGVREIHGHKNNGKVLRFNLTQSLGIPYEAFDEYVKTLYLKGMSNNEISEFILQQTGRSITARSLQRITKAMGISRGIKEAFSMARARGRVVFQLEMEADRQKAKPRQLSPGLRWKVLKRDKFKCVACGIGKKEGALLQIDHKIARVNGGTNEPKNLRTLCLECNEGKRIEEKEFSPHAGTMRSGKGGEEWRNKDGEQKSLPG